MITVHSTSQAKFRHIVFWTLMQVLLIFAAEFVRGLF